MNRLLARCRRPAWLFFLLPILGFAPALSPGADTAASAVSADDAATLRAAAALYEGIRTETLPNGLRVYLQPIAGAPVISTMVAYKVGSSDENLDATGLSHYLEHLMFKGTDKIMPGDIDRMTLRFGGRNNAYTSEDYTIYHFDFAADQGEATLRQVLGVEADRMHNLRIDAKHEFEQEKGAVISELEMDEDNPWDIEQKTILPLLFGKRAPYGHPVIGERRDQVRAATAAVIKSHYDKWYHPNNASLVVCGGFDADRTLKLIKELFGALPAKKLPERKSVPEGESKRPVHQEIPSKFDVPRMVMGFNTVASGHPDFYALEVVQTLLAGGKTSRLYRQLVEGAEVASQVQVSDNAGRYPGWFEIQLELLKGKDRAAAEKIVVKEMQRLRDEPVSPAELKRVQQNLLTGAVFGREGVHELADSIARGVTTNDLDFLKNYLPNIIKVSAADVQRVARKYLDSQQRVVIWSVPPAAPAEKGQGALRKEGRSPAPARGKAAESAGATSLKDAKRVVLPNGLVLLLYENHRLPIVVAEASVRHVGLLEPEAKSGIATLMGSLLDEGTAKHSGPQIAELIEDVGGSLTLGSSGGSVSVLARHRHLGLELLFECLTQANFPKEAFARERAKLLSLIDESEQQPRTKAQMVYRAMLYGKHPFGRPAQGQRKTVEALTPADCVSFYHRLFVPNNTVVAIVGDFDSKQVTEELTRLTADWKKAPVPKPELPEVLPPKEFTQKVVTMPLAAQLNFYLGHVGIRRNSPDYYKLLVMDYVLGTGPGFTDRLSSQLRDREGLAYTVTANITSSAGEEPGLFTCYIGTEAKNFARVKEGFLREVKRIREEKASDEEVEDAKKYLLGSLPFELTTSKQIADQLLYVDRYGLGFGYLDDYRKAVAAVTPADVQAVAKKYLNPQRMVLVVVGAINAAGKPLDIRPEPKP